MYHAAHQADCEAESDTKSAQVATEDPEMILGMCTRAIASPLTTFEAEFNAYIQEPQEATDSLRYWEVSKISVVASGLPLSRDILLNTDRLYQSKQTRFPTLYRMAMDILPIQASAVPCERVFSSSKETMSGRRNRINPGLMEALQMLKFSI